MVIVIPSIEEALRLHHECGRSQREIARSCRLFSEPVNKVLCLVSESDLVWPLSVDLNEAQLQLQLYGWHRRKLEAIDSKAVHEHLKLPKCLAL